ncbi:hypothetical protein GIB67_036112 [Kingdonia uniflora]|uniref:MULE transposase domain-containing protein n=1 Tax=Kingdonia uniflora TaxID=39325 RepID=A0A7J7N9G3_9MAGN|nr:hypothetical protein GIB67_036112 [Kingdonia uniflora]
MGFSFAGFVRTYNYALYMAVIENEYHKDWVMGYWVVELLDLEGRVLMSLRRTELPFLNLSFYDPNSPFQCLGPDFIKARGLTRSLDGTHTCDKNSQNGHHQASVDWVVNFIEERLRGNLNYKPKDILLDVHKHYGITIPYKQAWRAKELGLAAIYGSSEEGYFLLPGYCEQIKLTNPESIAHVSTLGSDNRFQHLFIAFDASIWGFLSCLPLIGLGAIQLKSKYLGTLLLVTSFDADDGLFLLAFGIVDVQNDENWMWFLSELHKLLEMNTEKIPLLTLFSNEKKGIVDGVKRKFPSASHRFCMRHLSNEIGQEFRNSRLIQLFWKAAYSVTTSGFKEIIAEIEEVSA